MEAVIPFTGALGEWVALYMAFIARLSFIVFFLPGIGEQVIPVRVRLAVLLTLSAAFTANGVVEPPDIASSAGYIGLLITELTIGLFLGLSLRLSIWMLSIAGAVIAQAIGLAQFLGVALDHEPQTLISNILSLAGAALLLAADFHVDVVAQLIALYGEIPQGGLAELDLDFLIGGFFDAFTFALLLAWPFVAVNLLYNICLGFINKALPQLLVAFVGAPFIVGAGAALLAISAATLLIVWKDRVLQVIGWL